MKQNQLFLNPRLPDADRDVFERAWNELVEGRFLGQMGIATSGSSGDARGRLIILSKTALEASARAVNERLASGPHDVWFQSLPNFHVGGLSIRIRAELSGAHVAESMLKTWDVRGFGEELTRAKATLLSLVPTQVFDLVRADLRAPPGLRAVIVGGGRIESELYQQACALGWPLLLSYGLTECSSQVATASSPGDPRLRPLKHVEIRIGAGERIEIRSPALLSGQICFDVPDGAPRLLEFPAGSWFRTEDCGHLEEDGSLTVLGRSGDFVKIGGEGVAMGRLEDRLERLRRELHFQEDAAVLAANDERLGAVVVLLTTATKERAERLRENFNRDILPFERIREIHFLAELPRSPLGKLLRKQALSSCGREMVTSI